jgi:hypothetical protein
MKQEIWHGQFFEMYHLEDRIGLKWSISFLINIECLNRYYTGHYLAGDSARNVPYTVLCM